MRVWITASEEEAMSRLLARAERRAPVTEEGARSIHRNASARAAGARWDVVIDTSGRPRPKEAVQAVRALLAGVTDARPQTGAV